MQFLKFALFGAVAAASLRGKPTEKLAKEMTHDLEMNFNKIAPFGKEDTAKELQDHAADTQDTCSYAPAKLANLAKVSPGNKNQT